MHLGIHKPKIFVPMQCAWYFTLECLNKKTCTLHLKFYTVWDTWGFISPNFRSKISLQSIKTRPACYERWVHFKKLTGGKSLEPVYGRLWKGTSEKSRLGDVRILLLLSSLILFHISQALTLSASVSRFKAKCNTSIFHLRGGWG